MSGVCVSLQSLPKARPIFLHQERPQATLAALQCLMLPWLNTGTIILGYTLADFWKKKINSCVYVMNQ